MQAEHDTHNKSFFKKTIILKSQLSAAYQASSTYFNNPNDNNNHQHLLDTSSVTNFVEALDLHVI